MKANEFVKKFGWGWAKEVVDNQPEKDSQIFNPYNAKYSSSYTLKKGVSVAWLRTYVEAHDLVEMNKGIDVSRITLALQQAINLVESCQ